MALMFNEFSVAVQLTSTLLLPANDARVGLVISSPAANPVSLSFMGSAVADSGIVLRAGTAPLQFVPYEWGCLAKKPVNAITVVGAQTIGGYEVIDTEYYTRGKRGG